MERRRAALGLIGVGCSAAGVLVFEIVLTRVFSVVQFYHFAFLTVSLALLGFGASGAALAALPRLGRGGPRRWAVLAAMQGLATLAAYALTNRIPFDSFAIAWDRRQILYLIAYYLALAVPFFFGGAVIGTLLSGRDQPVPLPSHRVYGASLIGSGLGCVVAVAALPVLGGIGVIILASVLGLVAAVSFEVSSSAPSSRFVAGATGIAVAVILVGMAGPAILELRLSPYKDLSAALRYPGAQVVNTSWASSTRIEHITSEGIRSLPGLSFAWSGAPPPQDAITFDGDDLSAIPLVGPDEAEFSSHLLSSIAFSLRPMGDVLVLEPRGGLDVLVALAEGAGSVTAIESHRPAVEASLRAGSSVYADPRVDVVVGEPRSFVEHTDRRFDVVDIALTSPYRPVTSGAYSLAEDYLLTAEAFDAYLDLLRPGGLVTAMRWLQSPPSESMRLVALAADAVRESGGNPRGSVIALRGYANSVVMIKPEGFTSMEIETVARFAAGERFDIITAPDLGSSNIYNVLPRDQYAELAAFLLDEPDDLYASYDFDIGPPTDDRPFFTHFSKWTQASDVWAGLGRTWQPFGGAGFLVLLAFLGLSVVGAAVLILGPLVVMARRADRSGDPSGDRLWTVAYFGLLGLAFLMVEIPLVQHYILLVGRPTTALAVVLFSLLLAAGVGSVFSERVPWRPAAMVLAIASVGYPLIVRWLTATVLPLPLGIRVVAGVIVLVPLGFLMGIMFPRGLRRLETNAPHLVPWAWGINGTVSVIAAAAAALLALTWGFRLVVTVGAFCYGACAVLAGDGDEGRVSLGRE